MCYLRVLSKNVNVKLNEEEIVENLYVIGSGPGDESMLTGRAKNIINTAQRVLNTRETPLPVLLSDLKTACNNTVVLVSGDSGFFSLAKTIVQDFSDRYDIELLPGISSVQYLSAKLKIPYDDAVLISLHGRNINIVPKVAYNKKVFALTGGDNSAKDVCRLLTRYGLGCVSVRVGERLSYTDEGIVSGSAAELADMDFNGLSVIYIDNPSATNPFIPLRDNDFIRGNTPMTKEEIRWLSISKLGVHPQDTVFDIGAGTGSVAVELARKAYGGFVYAIEAKETACDLVRKNATRHGAFNIEIVNGKAPSAIENLPIPDRAFIGGSSGKLDGILEKLTSMNPDIRIVINAITLQTVNQAVEGLKKHGFADTEIICVNIAKSKTTGNYDLMTAQNPVYIISGGAHGTDH